MADVPGKFYRATKVRTGVSPSSPGAIEGEVTPPLNPPGGGLNSVGLTMPSAFNVANSPLTSNGTLAVTGAGTVGQYIRGDGSLADFPQASGGGSSVSYYLNGSVNQGTIGGIAYRELSKVPILGAGTQFTINADGYIAQFLTDAGDPNLLEIPGGNWNFETYFSASSGGGTPTFYVELYKYNGTTFTLIASSSTSPEFIAFGTNLTPYYSTLAVPTTTLALTDRLAVRYYVTHSGRTITMHTENNTLCQIVTTFTTGITALNGLTAQVQNFAVGTTGTDFNIASATATHTFNLPTASATNRGALSSADWSLFTQAYNDKINSASVTGTTTKTLTLTQQDGGTITASWSDLNTDAVLSVFGRTGAVVAANGDYTTAQVTESGNLYYTDARSRAALSFAAGSGAYNTSTGVITIPTNNNQITNGAGYITSAALAGYVQGSASAGQVAYWSSASAITGESALFWDSVNDRLGISTNNPQYKLDITNGDIRLNMTSGDWGIIFEDDGTLAIAGTKIWYSNNEGVQYYDSYWTGTGAGHLFRTNLNGTTQNVLKLLHTGNAVFYNNVTAGSFIRNGGTSSQYLMADGSVSTLSNPVTGTGTTNYLPKFTGSTTIGNSLVFDNGTSVGIGTASPQTVSSGFTLTVGNGATQQQPFLALSRNSLGGFWAGIRWYDGNTIKSVIQEDSDFNLRFSTSNAEAMRIFSGGNVHIGPTPSSDNGARLQVSGDIRINNGAADGGQLVLASSGFSDWNIDNFSGSLRAYYGSTEYLRLTSGGNLGLGVTPSAWGSSAYGGTTRVIEIGELGSSIGAGAGALIIGNNWYSTNSAAIYSRSGFPATQYAQNTSSGQHQWFTAPAGTAGNAISFTQAMTLTNAGYLVLGNTSSVYGQAGRGTFEMNGSADNILAMRIGGSLAGYLYTNSSNMELYSTTNIQFSTAGQIRATLSSAGNLILTNGAASDNGARLQVSGGNVTVTNSGNVLTTIRSTSNTGVAIIYTQNDLNNSCELGTWGSARAGFGAIEPNNGYIYAVSDLAIGSPTNLKFSTGASNSTRLTIDSLGAATFSSSVQVQTLQTRGGEGTYNAPNFGSGNLGAINILSTTSDRRNGITFSSAGGVNAQAGIYVHQDNSLGTHMYFATTNNYSIGPQARLTILNTGAATFSSSVTATSFFESSDATLKTLIADNYQAKGIDSVVAKLYIKNGKEEVGYFAQDLQGVLPSAVSKGSDGLLNLSYREVHTAKIAYLEEEIRQLKKKYENN